MYTCHRLTSALEVLDLWPFFRQGLVAVNGSNVDIWRFLKIFCHLASSDRGFVACVYQDKTLEGFGVMEDVTPIFSTTKQYLCRAFWHKTGNAAATNFLMQFFEEWAREQNVSSYSVTTDRHSGAAIRCFKSEKYGFRRSHIQFVKTLN